MEFLSEMIKEWFFVLMDWPLGTFIALLGLFCVVVVLLLIVYFILYAIDKGFGESKTGVGHISGKEFTPEHTEWTMVGKIPVQRTIEDDWQVTITAENGYDSVSVSETFYKRVRIGDRVKIAYVIGKLTGSLYVTDIL